MNTVQRKRTVSLTKERSGKGKTLQTTFRDSLGKTVGRKEIDVFLHREMGKECRVGGGENTRKRRKIMGKLAERSSGKVRGWAAQCNINWGLL